MESCSKCGKTHFLLNKNNVCPICVFSSEGNGEPKIFKEVEGKELTEENTTAVDFEKPLCHKCNKPVDLFANLYMIEYGATKAVMAKCHGEVEAKMITEYMISKRDTGSIFGEFFKEAKWEKNRNVKNISINKSRKRSKNLLQKKEQRIWLVN